MARQAESEGAKLAHATAEEIAAASWEELDVHGKRVRHVVTSSGRAFRLTSNVFWDMEPWTSGMYVIVKAAPRSGWRRFWPYKGGANARRA